jgi:lipoate-protein ligase A
MPRSFRTLDLTLPTVAANLALDEALLIEAEETGRARILRLWELPEPAVVMGASCRLREDVQVDACRAESVPIARRSSGGGTVVIGPGALNATVILDSVDAPGLNAVDIAQQYVLEQVADSIRGIGPPVEVLGLGDLVVAGRKVAGSAQRRLRSCFLVHVSILYDFRLELIARYTHVPKKQPRYRQGRSHEDFVTNLELSRERLILAVRSAWIEPGTTAEAVTWPQALTERLLTEKFNDREWVERL